MWIFFNTNTSISNYLNGSIFLLRQSVKWYWIFFSNFPKQDLVTKTKLHFILKNESAAYNLHSIGAVDFFNSLRADLTPELERSVDQILENILSQHFTTQSVSNMSRTSSSKINLPLKKKINEFAFSLKLKDEASSINPIFSNIYRSFRTCFTGY